MEEVDIEGVIPSECRVSSIVAPFMGEPLSECSTSGSMVSLPWAIHARFISSLACSADSSSQTSQPTISRLKRSMIR